MVFAADMGQTCLVAQRILPRVWLQPQRLTHAKPQRTSMEDDSASSIKSTTVLGGSQLSHHLTFLARPVNYHEEIVQGKVSFADVRADS